MNIPCNFDKYVVMAVMIQFQNPFDIGIYVFKKTTQVGIHGAKAYEIMLFLIVYESFVLLFFSFFVFVCLFVCFFIEANVDESNCKLWQG